MADPRGLGRRAARQSRAGRARMAARRRRPAPSTARAVASAGRRNGSQRNRRDRYRQTVHPLGQGRHPEPDRSFRAARFSRGHR
ncbi:MAG: hypothetical protein EHM55_14580 [Acidobacteria bacterium]|nr:MAG: hypothetical protein EHM55_14580 [Acidobacteriota bacterium]